MIYGSVCSGIEAATAAWHPLGWRPAFFAEIEAFPSAVLKHHYPDVSNVGDFTGLIHAAAPVPAIDVLVGGTPCQSFSVAGLRRGLADARGGLTLEFVRLAQRLRPRWIVWENVPGVLSQDGGRAFGAFLGALGELGYGWAYRVLDAQYFGVAQRRRRVFVVGHFGGDFARAAAVLFEPEGVRRDPPTRREAGQRAAAAPVTGAQGGSGGLGAGHDGGRRGVAYGFNFEQFSGTEGPISPCLTKTEHKGKTLVYDGPHVVAPPLCMAHGQGGAEIRVDGAPSLTCNHEAPIVFSDSGLNGQDAYTGRVLPVAAYNETPWDAQEKRIHDVRRGVAPTLSSRSSGGGTVDGWFASPGMAVRRLVPVECERLQGFPDEYTRIPWKGKPASECPDGPRYKALGNSMAVPVMRWIGERIAKVEEV